MLILFKDFIINQQSKNDYVSEKIIFSEINQSMVMQV
jgi:hypothetical protein